MHWRENKDIPGINTAIASSAHNLCDLPARKLKPLSMDNDKILNRTRERNQNDLKREFFNGIY